ncbi:MAG TPA: RsbRD N-terminal domain-containing protein [Polyangiaceae bacterium]
MTLLEVSRDRRAALAERWVELVLATYPHPTTAFLLKERDGFRNPVGVTLRDAIVALTNGLLAGDDPGGLAAHVDAVVRVRAVQDFSPAQAAGFVFLFRNALSGELHDELAKTPAEELLEIDARIDALALLAWERYALCREKISAIRAREATARTYALLKRAGLLEDATAAEGATACPSAEGSA